MRLRIVVHVAAAVFELRLEHGSTWAGPGRPLAMTTLGGGLFATTVGRPDLERLSGFVKCAFS